jgi:hypothetical protein
VHLPSAVEGAHLVLKAMFRIDYSSNPLKCVQHVGGASDSTTSACCGGGYTCGPDCKCPPGACTCTRAPGSAVSQKSACCGGQCTCGPDCRCPPGACTCTSAEKSTEMKCGCGPECKCGPDCDKGCCAPSAHAAHGDALKPKVCFSPIKVHADSYVMPTCCRNWRVP